MRPILPIAAAAALYAVSLGVAHADSYIYDQARDTTVVTTDSKPIGHFDSVTRTFSCPNGGRRATFGGGDDALFHDNSSAGVANWQWSYTVHGITLTFTNYNAFGDQTYSIVYPCAGRYTPDAQIHVDATTASGAVYEDGRLANNNVNVVMTCVPTGQVMVVGAFGEGIGQSIASGDGCRDRLGNAAAPVSFTINIDKTAPDLNFSNNAGTYTVDQMIDIHCTASDTMKVDGAAPLVMPRTCPGLNGPAYSFGVGQHAHLAQVTDLAGWTTTRDAKFSVEVTISSLKNLTQQFLGATNPVQTQALLTYLDRAQNPSPFASAIRAYQQLLAAEMGASITGDQLAQAKVLLDLSRALPTPRPLPWRTVADTDPSLKYSPKWQYFPNRPPAVKNIGNDIHATQVNGQFVAFNFTGDGIAFVTERSEGYGAIDVYVDGVFQQRVDTNAPGIRNDGGLIPFTKDLPWGEHSIKLVKINGSYMIFDGFNYHP